MSKRVLIAGLFHETHTFLEGRTALADFQTRIGEELWQACGDGSPLSGVLEVAQSRGWHVIPSIDMRATPSAIVDAEVFDYFWSWFRDEYENALPQGIDGICLVLHGAMVTTVERDVEGSLMTRIRALPGARDIPICGVLDLHGNISRETIEQSQGFVAYRCNPHEDAREAAVDAASLLDQIMSSGARPTAVYEPTSLLWPPTGTGTADEPMRTLAAMAREIERSDPDIAAVNVMAGFSFADTHDTGASFSAVTFGDAEVARRHLVRLRQSAVAHRAEAIVAEPTLELLMPRVLEHVAAHQTPVGLIEPSDNIGGGAPGDATSILRVLIAHRVERSAVVINDPEAVQALNNLAIGADRVINVGGKGSPLTEGPVELAVTLVSRSDGKFELEDRQSHLASMCGTRIDMGLCAVVQHCGVTILLTSRKTPPFDLGQLRSQGIEPTQLSVIGIKAAVAHRRAYDPILKASYTIATRGPCGSDPSQFPYRHLRRPIDPLDTVAFD